MKVMSFLRWFLYRDSLLNHGLFLDKLGVPVNLELL
jgi:hypothetical protein